MTEQPGEERKAEECKTREPSHDLHRFLQRAALVAALMVVAIGVAVYARLNPSHLSILDSLCVAELGVGLAVIAFVLYIISKLVGARQRHE